VAHPSQPYKTVKELIAYAKANPGKVTFGSPGSGASPHVSGELFKSMTGTDLLHVPYKGSAPAMTDLLGGQISIMFDNMPSAIQHVRSGKLRPIAVTTAKRSPELPDEPTIAEAGVKGYDMGYWFAAYVPAGTPAPVVARLNELLAHATRSEAARSFFDTAGSEAWTTTPEELARFQAAETRKWGRVIKASGIEPE